MAAWQPDGVDLTRPRILCRAAELDGIRARLAREPYQTLLRRMLAEVGQADGVALDDHSIDAERIKARAAKDLAAMILFDRTVRDGDIVPYDAAARAAASERVRVLLLNMYTRSRLAVAAPLGGWDRDISTAEELQQYATAYDALRGAGIDLGDDETAIVDHLAALAGELYENYRDPASAGGFTTLHQNNHRAKSGAAMATSALALAEYTPAAGSDPDGVREPTDWLLYGTTQVDAVMRYALVSGDGAYGEGPFYLRYGSQNLLPFWRAWDALTGGTAAGVTMPNFWRHPLLARLVQWELDNTLPDGSLAPTDDGNPFEFYYFGAAPLTAATAWRWTTGDSPLETDGNISLAAESVVNFDDALAVAPPDASPTSFYTEGGVAALRSDWSPAGVLALVQAEHGAAAEFGRYADGTPASPESHEHADGGSFLLHAFGERLALDPGYFSFTLHGMVNKPQDHNVILVNGSGPGDLLSASINWLARPVDPPPTDGEGSLVDTLDSDAFDTATALLRYGQPAARLERRFLFAADRYLLIADRATSSNDAAENFTWLLHGNGGGTSGGSFDLAGAGARWTRAGASLTEVLAVDAGPLSLTTRDAVHEGANRASLTHTVLEASATATDARSVSLLYPSAAGEAPPSAYALTVAGVAAVRLDAAQHRLLAWHRAARTPLTITADLSRLADVSSDGAVALFDVDDSGALRLAWAEQATQLAYDGVVYLATTARGRLGVQLAAGRASLVVDAADPQLTVHGLEFVPHAADGACALAVPGGTGSATIVVNRERRIVLRADDGNSAPAADPGPPQTVGAPPRVAMLDGRASCDADGDALTPHWDLVSAPAGSAWSLDGADSWQPALFIDRAGPYRVRLVVTDVHGAQSRPAEVVVVGGPPCADGVDNDRDGLIDEADPDCDMIALPAPAADGPFAERRLAVGESDQVDLAAGFAVADEDAVLYQAASVDAAVASATVHGTQAMLCARHPGRSAVLITAADDAGWAQNALSVEVVPRTSCFADCDGNGSVTVDEILAAVRIGIGEADVERCRAADADGDDRVVIDELVRAVADALDGCRAA